MDIPAWFSAIQWSDPVAIEVLRAERHRLPSLSGVYVFTNYAGLLEKGTGVLYVGKAATLRTRVPSYLVDPGNLQVQSRRRPGGVASSLKHAGKAQLLVELQQKSRGDAASGIWVRWTVTASQDILEQQLISYLRPAFNTQGID
jgi:hypothetical protein